jgi:hypothetical protein
VQEKTRRIRAKRQEQTQSDNIVTITNSRDAMIFQRLKAHREAQKEIMLQHYASEMEKKKSLTDSIEKTYRLMQRITGV